MIKSSYISRNRKPIFFDARTWWGMSQSAFSISLGTARTRHGMFQCSWNFCKISNIKLNINLKIWWHLLCSMFKEICFLSLSLTWKTRNIPSWVNSTCIKQTTNNDGKFRPKASTTSQKGPGSQLFFFSFSGPEALYHSGPAKSGIRYDEAANPWEFSAENGASLIGFIVDGKLSSQVWTRLKMRSMFLTCFVTTKEQFTVRYLEIIFGWCVQSESYYHFTSKFPGDETNIY